MSLSLLGHHRLVATVEKFYDVLERVHSTENGHVDYKKILAEVRGSGGTPLQISSKTTY